MVLALSGTTAVPSRTRALVGFAAAGLRARRVVVDVWDLAADPLPFADPDHHARPDRHPSEAVRSLVSRAQRANAFIWGSPVYHNSYTGVLKNLLDHLAIPQYERKPVGLVSHGACHRSTQACDHLRLVARGLHAIAIPTQVVSADSDFVLADGAFRLRNRAVIDRLARFVDELLLITDRAAQPTRTSGASLRHGVGLGGSLAADTDVSRSVGA